MNPEAKRWHYLERSVSQKQQPPTTEHLGNVINVFTVPFNASLLNKCIQ